MNAVFWSLFLMIPSFARAAVFEGIAGPGALEGVAVFSQAKVKSTAGEAPVKSVGAGLRVKKVVFVKAKVYVAQLLVDKPETVVKTKDGILPSLDQSNLIAMHLTFLRDVEAKKVEGAFRDALKENSVPLEEKPIKEFLEAVKSSGDAKEKKTVVVLGGRDKGVETLIYEDSNGKTTTITAPKPGFLRQVFSLWFGRPADSGVEDIRDEILGLRK